MSSTDVLQPHEIPQEQTPLDPQEIKDAIQKQLEFYFSQENLSKDSYLVSQMNSQMAVPITVLAQFTRLKQYTQDHQLIVEAVKQSDKLILSDNDTAIRPNVQQKKRNTIILREIPSDAQPEEIKTIFQGLDCEITDIRSDIGDTWFVVLASEKQAIDVLMQLGSRTFRNMPVKARLKSETSIKSFIPVAVATENVPNSMPFMVPPVFPPFGAPHPAINAFYPYNYMPPNQDGFDRKGGRPSQNDWNVPGQTSMNKGNRDQNRRGRFNKVGSQSQQVNSRGPRNDQRYDHLSAEHVESNEMDESRLNRNNRSQHQKNPKYSKREHETKKKDERSNSFRESDAKQQPLVPGYHVPHISYTQEDILEIVKNMSNEEIFLPQGLDLKKHSYVLEKEPNQGLLQNQRTFSIDQTREQLCQGRPVHKEAVVPGNVDYGNLIYGEGYSVNAPHNQKKGHDDVVVEEKDPEKSDNKKYDEKEIKQEVPSKNKKSHKTRKNSSKKRHESTQDQQKSDGHSKQQVLEQAKKQAENEENKDLENQKIEETTTPKAVGYAAALIRGGLTSNQEKVKPLSLSQQKEAEALARAAQKTKGPTNKQSLKNQGTQASSKGKEEVWKKVQNNNKKTNKKKEKFVPRNNPASQSAQQDTNEEQVEADGDQISKNEENPCQTGNEDQEQLTTPSQQES